MTHICQTCAIEYDPKVTSSPLRYCSQDCYDFGSRPYNRTSYITRADKIKLFAIKTIDRIHWCEHNNDDRSDCDWDLCVEAKILGL